MRRPVAACSVCAWLRYLGRTVREVQAVRTAARAHCAATSHTVELRSADGRALYRIMRGRVSFVTERMPRAVEARR